MEDAENQLDKGDKHGSTDSKYINKVIDSDGVSKYLPLTSCLVYPTLMYACVCCDRFVNAVLNLLCYI